MRASRVEYECGLDRHGRAVKLVKTWLNGGAPNWSIIRNAASGLDEMAAVHDLTTANIREMFAATHEEP